MPTHSDDTKSALEAFLSGPSLDPEAFDYPPPLKDGKDPLPGTSEFRR